VKSRISIHLSEQIATRLAAAAERPGATRSGLVEAALERFLESDADAGDAASVAHLLGPLRCQLESLSRELKAVNEIVALHARFTLAMAPMLPTAAHSQACKRGSARFDEFATQVERRMQSGTSLLQETLDRLSATDCKDDSGVGASRARTPVSETLTPGFNVKAAQRPAAVREGGSKINFPGRGNPLQ
jgi:predicted DNA-binding protein